MQQYKVGDRVIHMAYGLGKIAALQSKQLFAGESRLYYEVVTAKNTIWVPVDAATPTTLRPLTTKAELSKYADLLKSKPHPLNEDRRMRQTDLNERLKPGTFQAMCEIVRDLNALNWRKPLREADSALLRRVSETLSQEWAIVAGITPIAASQQIDALMAEAKQIHQAQ
jgi:RNA polymerase-interacting CarD/CdnL/TRCF family regulator